MKEPGNCLGVSLGTRRLGMSVGNHHELIDYYMKAFPQTYSKKKTKKIWRVIERAIERYGITVIGMKLPPQYSHSEGISNCLKCISKKALENNIVIFFYDLRAIEKHFLKSESKTKTELADRVAEKYPELKKEVFKIGKSQHNMKLFEAVASMDLALLELL